MRKIRIVTHSGTAHRDEFLACCAVLFHEYATNRITPSVERRLALPDDLDNPGTYVIDTGGVWVPDMLNFDHHQPDHRLEERCALDLLLEFLVPEKVLCGFADSSDWLKLTAVQDTKGSAEAARFLGVTTRTYSATRSPVERAMLKWFSGATDVHPDSPLHHAMREIGRGMLKGVDDVMEQLEALEGIPGPVDVCGIRLWDIRGAWGPDDRYGFSVVNKMAGKLRADVVVGHNSRHRQVGLYRQDWSASKVDLSRISSHPKHLSSHQSGFYAVVSRDIRDFELLEMIRIATNTSNV